MGRRLIDTDAAYAVLTDYYHHTTDTQHAALREALGRVPTVEVVRCKNCRYWDVLPASTAAPAYHECKVRPLRMHTTAEDFCSRGEQKGGDGDG